jgi:hypothetical protein
VERRAHRRFGHSLPCDRTLAVLRLASAYEPARLCEFVAQARAFARPRVFDPRVVDLRDGPAGVIVQSILTPRAAA